MVAGHGCAGSRTTVKPKSVAHERTGIRRTIRSLDRERERIERDAYQRGFSRRKRSSDGSKRQPNSSRSWTGSARTLAELSSLRSRIRKDAEGDLLKLSISVARRVLHRELTLDPESIEGLIRIALEKLQSRDVCRIRVASRPGAGHPSFHGAILQLTQGGTDSPILPCNAATFSLKRRMATSTPPLKRNFAKSNAALRTGWEDEPTT